MKKINPLKLDWDKAVMYRKVGTVSARPAADGEVINGEVCKNGDLINTSNPDRHYRIPAERVAGAYEATETPGVYKTISEPRRVVFLEREGFLVAPWPDHRGWPMKKGQPVIEVDNKGKKEFITQRDFEKAYKLA